MYRIFGALLLAAVLATGTGCILPIYSGEPARRTEQLIYTSEGLRELINVWERFWFMDQPDHMSPTRVHGGMI